ncbi:MAG: FecR domain-containing protein [Spirochaetota bacterium]
MKSLIKNTLLPLVNFTVIALAGYFLYLDFSATVQHSGTEQIGTITFKKRIAERKYTQQVIWERLRNNSPVYNFDAIRTDTGSLAVINMDDGTSLELDEETMVILQKSQRGLDIDFEQGGISAKTSESSSGKLNIKSGDTSVALASGGLNMAKTGEEELNVNVESGSAELTASGQTTQIDPTKAATVTGGAAAISEVNIRLLTPQASKNIVSQGAAPVTFSWQLESAERSTLQVSMRKDFSSLIADRSFTAESPSATISLDEGIYYWRVVSGNSQSVMRRLAVVTENRPIILRPFNRQNFIYRTKRPLVTFKWNGAESAYTYKVEISSNSDMSNPLQRFQTYDNLVSTDELGPGTWHCRVTALYNLGNERKEVASTVTSFTVAKQSELKPPRLISPYNNKKLLVENSSTIFNWEKITEASAYQITVTDTSSGREIVNTRTSSNFYNYLQTLPPGTYRWNVVSIASDGTRSDAGSPFSFRVTSEGKITPLTPARGQKFLAGEPIRFTWKDENQGQRYELQIARDPLFTTTVLRQPQTTRAANVTELGGGTYYWRIHLLDDQNNSVIRSDSFPFTVIGTLAAPRLVSPKNRTYPHDVSSIQFDWNRVSNATHYRLKVYRKGIPSSTLITSKSITGTSYTINASELQDGGYFWTVQAYLQRGGRTVMQSPTAQNDFSKEKKKIPKITTPKIESPSTIYIQ